MADIVWGDIATWVTGTGTIALFCVALKQIGDERATRNAREKRSEDHKLRDQAEHISAWVTKLAQAPDNTWVAVTNQSLQPVYEVVVTLVMVQGDGGGENNDASGFTRPFSQLCVSIVPPGRGYVSFPSSYSGMNRHPGVEIAFKDKSGHCWLRKANGDLSEIKGTLDHYRISRPTSWTLLNQSVPPTMT